MKTPIVLLTISLTVAGIAAQEPPDVVTEKSTPIPAWSVSLIEVDRCRPESDVCGTELVIEHGSTQRTTLARELQGPFLPLLKTKVIFACESNAIMGAKAPLLVTLKGRITELPHHPGYLRSCSAVGTGEEVMLIYSLVESDKPYSLVRVMGPSGQTLIERRFNAAGELEFNVSGKLYRAAVPAPDWPG